MLPTKSNLILFFSLILISFNGKCQLLSDSSANLINIDQNNVGNDSIDKKQTKDKHSADFKSGKEDAKENYTDNRVFAITFFSSLLVPPAGFITTIALSTIQPKIKNLNVPNEQLLKNDQYYKGYMQKATRMKAGRAWGGCLTGLAFFGIAFFMVYDL